MVQRLRAHLGLAVAWAVLICLGTLVADRTWLAVTAMVVIGFLVLFSGVVSSVLAGASTALLLAFILPVALARPVRRLRPARGSACAAAAAMLAVTLLWPRPSEDPLSAPAARVCCASRPPSNCAPTRPSWPAGLPRRARLSAVPEPTRPPRRRPSCAPSSTPPRTAPPACPPARAPSSVWSTN